MPQPTLSYQQLTAVAAEFGTPVYVYDANYITHQYQQLTAAFAQYCRFTTYKKYRLQCGLQFYQ